MFAKSLFKNPVLTIGIILFGMFLFQVAKKEEWGIFKNDKLNTTSCRGALVRIEKKVPANWKVYCEGNNLAVEIKETIIPADAKDFKTLMYRDLANHMSFIARISQTDILEKVFFVRFKLSHPKMDLNAVTEGKFIVKLATLDTPEHIKAHLQNTVQVQEKLH